MVKDFVIVGKKFTETQVTTHDRDAVKLFRWVWEDVSVSAEDRDKVRKWFDEHISELDCRE